MIAVDRRTFLKGAGALVVAFGLPGDLRAQTSAAAGSGSPLDAWLAVGQDERVTLFAGKVELGTGLETAFAQIAAEELDVPVERVDVVMGDTARTPDQGLTTGSKSIQQGGPQIRQAAAEARQTLVSLAASRLGVSAERLSVVDGVVAVTGEPSKRLSYGELIGGQRFNRAVTNGATPKTPDRYRLVGRPVRRVDIPAKVAGTYVYTQNVRVPGMLYGCVVRPSALHATLVSVDEGSVKTLPGVVRVVSRGNFVGVVAQREEQAMRAARELKVVWRDATPLPAMTDLYESVRRAPSADKTVVDRGNADTALAGAAKSLHATYQWPFQMHASIGPSCAVADVREGEATVWSGTQGSYDLRDALAPLLGLSKDRVRVIWVEASGCYGHNGADDVAADAALLSQAVGRPVRVQWTRADEHGWEPKGPAMVMDVRGGLDAQGKVTAWTYEVWTPTHSTRPRREPGNLLAGHLLGVAPRVGLIGGDRNANHTYVFPHDRVIVHWLRDSVLRPSALRGLGAPQNSFANESFMDELAAAAGVDPLDFRLRHLTDPRAIAVLEAVRKLARWEPRPAHTSSGAVGATAAGRGIAYAQYESQYAYVAAVVDVEVNRATGATRVARVFVAHDCGLIVNPDGLRNQIEGAVVQTISRTLKEAVGYGPAGVVTLDWASYPILTFPEAPDDVQIALIDRPDKPAVGAGEPAVCPIPAAIANGIFDATGARVRTVPLTPERVKAAFDRA